MRSYCFRSYCTGSHCIRSLTIFIRSLCTRLDCIRPYHLWNYRPYLFVMFACWSSASSLYLALLLFSSSFRNKTWRTSQTIFFRLESIFLNFKTNFKRLKFPSCLLYLKERGNYRYQGELCLIILKTKIANYCLTLPSWSLGC